MFSTFAQQINTRLNSLAEHSKKDQELQGLSVEEIERRLSQLE